MKASPLDIPRVQAPLVIGVTGHRDLRAEDVPKLEDKVRQVLTRLRSQFPHTPFVLLSALAEGADRLAARVALQPDIGARLVVPLPMPQAMYEADFESAQSKEEFRSLLYQADSIIDIGLLADEEAVKRPGPERNRQYEAMGKRIVRECQILIALWDGTKTGKVGGTAAVVDFQREGLPERREDDLQPPELFPVYQILTPRQANPNPSGAPFELTKLYPRRFVSAEEGDSYYARLFGNLDDFNRQIAIGGDALAADAAQSKRYLLGDFDPANLSAGEALSLARYTVADAFAIRYQAQMKHMHRALHWYVFFSFLGFVLFAHLPAHPAIALAVAFGLLWAGVRRYHQARREGLDNKRQDYRALAEGCRVRFFWQMAGVDESVPDNYLGKQRTELDWIRNALRGWSFRPKDDRPGAFTGARQRLDFVQTHWVNNQLSYFETAGKRHEEKSEHTEKYVSIFLWAAIGIALVVLALAAYGQIRDGAWWVCEWCEKWVDGPVIAIDMLLAAGALMHHAGERMAYAEQKKQYKRMRSVFENASRVIGERLEGAQLDAARKVLWKLGQEALAENGDWVLLYRERPLELPHP